MNLHYAHKSNPGKADDSTAIRPPQNGRGGVERHWFRKLSVSLNNSLKSIRLKGSPRNATTNSKVIANLARMPDTVFPDITGEYLLSAEIVKIN